MQYAILQLQVKAAVSERQKMVISRFNLCKETLLIISQPTEKESSVYRMWIFFLHIFTCLLITAIIKN